MTSRRWCATWMAVLAAAACGGDDGDVSPGVDAPPGADAAPDGNPAAFTLSEVGHLVLAEVEDLQLDGATLYAMLGDERVLATIDVSDATAPTLLDTLEPAGVTGANTHFAIANGRAYLPRESDGLLVANLATPAALAEAGRFATGLYAKDVAVAGTTAYVADQDHGLAILDVSAATPHPLGALATDGPFGVEVVGTHVYLADNDAGLVVVDASTPASPTVAGTLPALDGIRVLAASGTHVYTLHDTATGSELVVVDVSDPAHPAITGRVAVADGSDVEVIAPYAYVATDEALAVFDVSNPTAPTLATTFALPAGSGLATVVADATHVYLGVHGEAAGQSRVVVLAKTF